MSIRRRAPDRKAGSGEDSTDEALLTAARAGDQEAFSMLFHRYQGPLYGFLARTMDDPVRAEDVLQDVFLRLLQQRGRIDHVKGWLYRTAANRVIDGHRRLHREVLVHDPYDGVTVRPIVPDPAETVVQQDGLGRALGALGPDHRVVVGLHYFADLPVREVAAVLRVPEGTVKSRLGRAYRILGEALRREEAR